MVIYGTSIMPDATNITVTTALSLCYNSILDINQTVYDLKNLYENNISNVASNIFLNVSIINFSCTGGINNYFEQIITFTRSVSIQIQILFASIYFDYIKANNYQLNGFIIDREAYLNFSSITVNNSVYSDACSTGEAAHDPLCQTNLTHPICTLQTNRWNFTCSENLITTTTTLLTSSTTNSSLLETTMISSGLNSWQIGLICGSSVLFLLFTIFLLGYFYRRYTHSKQLALSRVNLYDDVKLMRKSGIPYGQAFQQVATIMQPKHNNNTDISWIYDSTATNIHRNDENFINLQVSGLYNQVTFVDHAKVHDPGFPSSILQNPMTPVSLPTSPLNRPKSTIMPPIPISGTSTNQLKSITNELQENKLNESDNISLDEMFSNSPKKPSTPISRQFVNLSSIDESLHDEDAWMSILDVVNAELAALDDQEY